MTQNPGVSVIMPVYNAGVYLDRAIRSILQQSYRDFELIIINDHSKDNSEQVILSYDDPRIVYRAQQENRGVIEAMNLGISMARAPYICVMHADDIALPQRLEWQKDWLDRHPDAAIVAGRSKWIDEHDQPAGSWPLDDTTISRDAIRKTMPWESCISHPTVMIRTDVLRKYGGYDISQQRKEYAVEDYPLWLTILSDGYEIDKIAEPVLLYRVHRESTTQKHYRKQNPFLLTYHTKKIFLQQKRKQRKLNTFDRAVQISMYLDWIKAQLKKIKSFFVKSRN